MSHRDGVDDAGLDFLLEVFLNEEFNGGPIIVDEYRLCERSDERTEAGTEREILTMISVLLTSWKGLGFVRRLPKPINLPRATDRRVESL